MIRLVRWIALSVVAMGLAFGADVSGKWKGSIETPNGPLEQTFTFKVDGANLTGGVSSQFGENPISEGKVDGDNISFIVVFKFEANEFRIAHKGKLTGEELKLDVSFGDNGGAQMTLKRDKP
jgi:hypothetical protein